METSSLFFTVLGEGDLSEVAELEARSFTTPWSAEQYRLMLRQGGCRLFGVRSGPDGAGGLLAYIAVSAHPGADELEVYNIAVSAPYRRAGAGKKLLRLALTAAARNGIVRALLEVRENNAPAIALYRSLGFTRVGTRPKYYPDTGEDAHVYACDLSTLQ